ncbi:MAG: hypothetical protein ABSC94_00815, partial [Polyangiaceae bacterium]
AIRLRNAWPYVLTTPRRTSSQRLAVRPHDASPYVSSADPHNAPFERRIKEAGVGDAPSATDDRRMVPKGRRQACTS